MAAIRQQLQPRICILDISSCLVPPIVLLQHAAHPAWHCYSSLVYFACTYFIFSYFLSAIIFVNVHAAVIVHVIDAVMVNTLDVVQRCSRMRSCKLAQTYVSLASWQHFVCQSWCWRCNGNNYKHSQPPPLQTVLVNWKKKLCYVLTVFIIFMLQWCAYLCMSIYIYVYIKRCLGKNLFLLGKDELEISLSKYFWLKIGPKYFTSSSTLFRTAG